MPDLINLRGMPIRALVIDDHVDVADTACELLRLLGCKTAAAFGGITGARLAELFRPDIVFLDLGMPDLDGEAALVRIREAGRVDALFVCMTGRDDPALRERSLEAGFDLFLTKPVELEVLERLIEQVRLSRRRPQTQTSAAARSHGVSSAGSHVTSMDTLQGLPARPLA